MHTKSGGGGKAFPATAVRTEKRVERDDGQEKKEEVGAR